MVSCTLGPTDHAIATEALQLRNPPNGMPDLRPPKTFRLCGSRKVNKAGPLRAGANGAVTAGLRLSKGTRIRTEFAALGSCAFGMRCGLLAEMVQSTCLENTYGQGKQAAPVAQMPGSSSTRTNPEYNG
jgi:hypothetical protein